jgi:enoyl-CoA hydratase
MTLVETSDHDDGIRVVRLNDPDRRNAMGLALGAQLRDALVRCGADGVRAVVLTGAGSAFCAGADLPELFGDPDRALSETAEVLRDYYRAFLDVYELPQPTIAAVNGPAVGAGLNLALACDLRVAGTDATFGATFARIGLHPGGGCTWFLVHQLGYAKALDILLRGRTLDASEAVGSGLATGPSDDPVADAVDLARSIAETEAPLAVQIKRTARLAAGGAPFEAVLEAETAAQAESARSPRLQEWVARFRR